MSSVVSKNLYELLGNDPELDPDREPEPPTKVMDKPVQRAGKRNAGAEGPPKDTPRPAGGGRGGRHEVFTGSEQAARDKGAGAVNNRARPTDDGVRQDRHPNRMREPNEHRDIGSRGRGSRGGRGYGGRGTRTGRDDRHSRTNVGEHDKQAAHGWGAETGEAELADETGGLADARTEEKEGVVADDTPVDENGTPATAAPTEPEDNTKSYEQYLAEQLEKKAAMNDRQLEIRKANEGSSKKFPEGKAFSRGEEEEAFIAGSGGKARRERERKAKSTLDIDQTWQETPELARDSRDSREARGGRGGRGRGRGGGEFRGEGGRGRGRGRGEFRGGERGGDRGADRGSFRGNRGGPAGSTPNITDSSAFPSLGGK